MNKPELPSTEEYKGYMSVMLYRQEKKKYELYQEKQFRRRIFEGWDRITKEYEDKKASKNF